MNSSLFRKAGVAALVGACLIGRASTSDAQAPAAPAQGNAPKSSQDFQKQSGGSSSNPYGPGYNKAGSGSAAFAGSSKPSGPSGSGPGGAPTGPGGSSSPGGGGGTEAVSDFKTPIKGAESFLSALKAKDLPRLAEATAKRAEFESSNTNRAVLTSLLSSTIETSDLDALARKFEGMKVGQTSTQKSTGSIGVVVEKTEENTYVNRTITMRKEKDGWKVLDWSGARVLKRPAFGKAKKKS